MSIRRRSSSAVTISGTVDVDLDHTTDSVTIGDETNKLVLIDSGGTKTIPVKIYGAGTTPSAVDDAAFTIAVDSVGPIGAVYKSTPDTIDDGDVGAVHMTSTRAMHVYIKGTDVGAGGGTSSTDSAAYTPTTSSFTPIGGGYDDVSTDSLAEGEMGIVRLTATRKMHVYDSGVEALLTTQAGYLDGIEALLTSANGYQDGIETLITSTNTKLDTLAGYLDGVEGILTTIDADTGSIMTSVQLIDDVIVADNAGFTDGTTKLAMAGFIYDEVAGTVVTENDAVAARVNLNRAQVQLIEDGVTRGRWATVSAANALKVDGSAVTQPCSLASLPALVAGSANIGDVDVLSVIAAASTNKCDIGLINAVTPLMGAGNTGTGSLRVTIATDQANFTTPMNVNTTQINGVAYSTGTGIMGTGVQRVAIASDNDALTVKQATAANLNAAVVGNIAHDTGVSGPPVRIGGRAMLTNGTAVAEDDVADIATDNQGRVITTQHAPRDLITHTTTTITSSVAETTILAAGAASVFHDLTQLIITNSTATALIVTIKDATAGTTRMIVAIAANGGIVMNFGDVPCCQAAAAAAWTATCGTSLASIYFYVQAVKRIA